MAVSFFLNRRFVFRATAHRAAGRRVRFIAATLIGIFVIQNLLTQLFASNFQDLGTAAFRGLDTVGLSELTVTVSNKTHWGSQRSFTINTVAFGLATIVSLTWNFLTYKYWAFRQDDGEQQ